MRLIDIDAINPMRCPQSIAEMREWFDELPTAYDIDKVVRQFWKTSDCYRKSRGFCDDTDCFECRHCHLTLKQAIEIVKKGGAV